MRTGNTFRDLLDFPFTFEEIEAGEVKAGRHPASLMAGQKCVYHWRKPHDSPKWKVVKMLFPNFGDNPRWGLPRPSIFTLKTNKQTPIFIEIKSSAMSLKGKRLKAEETLGKKKLPDSSQSLYPGSHLNHPKQVNKFSVKSW